MKTQGKITAFLLIRTPLEGKVEKPAGGNGMIMDLDHIMARGNGPKKNGGAKLLPLELRGRLRPKKSGKLSTRSKTETKNVRGRGAKSRSGKGGKAWGWEPDSSQPGIVEMLRKESNSIKGRSPMGIKIPFINSQSKKKVV